jgi:hypothetical protein
MSKDHRGHLEFESSIGFMKKLNLIFQMSGQGFLKKKATFMILLFKNMKGTCFKK